MITRTLFILSFALLFIAEPILAAEADRLFVAVGYGGRRMSSRDGVHWSNDVEWAAKGGDDDNVLFNVAFAKAKFVAVGGSMTGRIVTTTDGKTWHEQPKIKWRVATIAFGNGRFVAGHTDHFLFSDDGDTWTEGQKHTFKGGIHMRKCAFGNGVFVVTGDADRWKLPSETENPRRMGCRAVTKNGEKFDSLQIDTPPARGIAFGNGRFVVVGPDGLRESSTDGVKWEHRASEPKQTLDSVIFDGKQFITSGGGFGYSSPDGITWTKLPKGIPCSVHYGDGKLYIGATWGGKLWHSTDGILWKKSDNPEGNAFEAVAVGNVKGDNRP